MRLGGNNGALLFPPGPGPFQVLPSPGGGGLGWGGRSDPTTPPHPEPFPRQGREKRRPPGARSEQPRPPSHRRRFHFPTGRAVQWPLWSSNCPASSSASPSTALRRASPSCASSARSARPRRRGRDRARGDGRRVRRGGRRRVQDREHGEQFKADELEAARRRRPSRASKSTSAPASSRASAHVWRVRSLKSLAMHAGGHRLKPVVPP